MSEAQKNHAQWMFHSAGMKYLAMLNVRSRIINASTDPIQQQRNALLDLSARLLESELSKDIEQGIKEWYLAHDKEAPPPASGNVGNQHSG